MPHDIVIRSGLIADGSGSEPYAGDVAIDADQITAVGDVSARGRREIDAEGHMVTPGFVDLHTHLDAQIGWDPELTPVSWHGVTTALMGNCGVTFAPCKPADKELLASMMETVEDIPREAILSGLPWNWEGYGGYLDAIDSITPGINIAGLVGHCAVRFYVMGERAVEEQATPDEKRRMAEIVGQSIDDGAYGFSTNRFVRHVLPDGRSIPGTFAEKQELIEIAKAVAPRRALMQNVLNFDEWEFSTELLRDLARTTSSRVLFSFGVSHNRASGRRAREYVESLCEGGLDITAISQPRASGFVFGLQSTLPVRGPTWKGLRDMPLAERLAAIENPETHRKLVAELQPELVHDFPGGAPRFIQRSKRYRATLVNGQVSIENGAHVGARAGRVLRHAH